MKVFIGYVRDDLKIAMQLYRDLKNAGAMPWLDKQSIIIGRNWEYSISQVILNSSCFIALLSTRSLTKEGFAKDELKSALDIYDRVNPPGVFILPVRINRCFPKDERFLKNRGIDLFPSYKAGLGRIIVRLLPDSRKIEAPLSESKDSKIPKHIKHIHIVKDPSRLTYPRRSNPIIVSEADARETFKLKRDWSPAHFVENEYMDNKDGTVSDFATGLIWQKSGSLELLDIREAKQYANNLNRQGFAGYDDWRLPTVEELTSLIEPEKQVNNRYIYPIFHGRQWWCCSSDKRKSGGAWVVDFHSRRVDWYSHNYYVRVVRS